MTRERCSEWLLELGEQCDGPALINSSHCRSCWQRWWAGLFK